MKLQGIVLVAGEGARLRPLTFTVPKPLIPLLGRPLIEHSIGYLRNAGIRDLVLVVGYLGHLFKERLGDGSRLGVSLRYVTQEKRLGIAHAIYRVVEEEVIRGPFVVQLGDNFFENGVSDFVGRFLEGGYDVFIVLTRARDPRRFGYVLVENGKVLRLIEKPQQPPPGGYTLTGFYAFRDPDLVKRAFGDIKPSRRGEYEITDLIQWFVDRGYRVGYTVTSGWWKDVGTPESLLEALYLLLDEVEPYIRGEVSGEVVGRVVVEEGAVVEGRVYGPAYIGRGAVIGEGAVVEHYVSIESGSKVVSGSITRSLVLNDSLIDINKLRLVDSVIGRGSVVRSLRELHGKLRLAVSDYSRVEL